MKPASVVLPFAALAFVIACGGTGTTIGGGTGPDPAPSTGDNAGSSTDHPPSSTDPSGAGNCLTCAGSYKCGTGTDATIITAVEKDGVCSVLVDNSQSSITVDPCTGVATGGITVKASADGILVCVPDNGKVTCTDCVPYTPPPPKNNLDAG